MRILTNIKTILLWAIYLPVVGITYLVVWLDRKIQFPLPFPRHLTELSEKEEWCIAELKKGNALPEDAVVTNYKVTPLNQEIIFRSNAGVIEINYTTGAGNKTLRCFAKFAPTMGTVWNKAVFNLQLNHIKEIYFNEYFVKADERIPAPRVFVSKVSIITGHLCLITEMMDDCMEYEETVVTNISDAHLENVLEGLATVHARYWKDTSAKMVRVMPIDATTVQLFDSMVAFSWSKAARKILVQSWRNMNEYQTILHGDARVANMMFPKPGGSGRFVLFDWQAVRKGKAVYDLAYFLVLSLITNHREAVEERCIESYYLYLTSKGVKDYSREELKEDYRHACLCVLLLLSLPMLSGEVSAEGNSALLFVYGMGIWRDRLEAKFKQFDYRWLAERYQLTEQESREAVTEMLTVIENRLKKIERDKIT